MKRSWTVPSILLAASLLLLPSAKAAGLIVVDPVAGMPAPVTIVPVPGHPSPVTPDPHHPTLKGSVTFGLRLQSADIKVDIADQVAKTYITQTFINDTDSNLAGTYLFPLPDDTTFSSFSLQIDGKPVEGKILEAQEARQQYEEIVRRMVDPGLLEYADYKTVRARIFPIPAHGTKKVELEYTQVLKAENGMLKYRFPLKTEGESSAAEEIKVNVKLSSKQGLRTIWSPSHTITQARNGDHEAKVAYLGKDTVPDKDFFLYYSVSDKDLAANLITNKTSGEDGYYLLTLTPPVESKEVIGKDIVLVADTSGSMQGERMTQNKQALKYLVNALNKEDRFSIVQFNTDVDSFKTKLVDATAENKKEALAYIEDLEARGGTNIGDAMKIGSTMLDNDSTRPGYLVLMTDGEPTVGETTIPGLLKSVSARRDIRVFDFGVGYDVNCRLLNKLAEEHHGTAQYVEPDESIETSLSSFYEKIKSPVLSNVAISYEGIQAKDVYPRQVTDIFAGTQMLLIGRYKGAGDATVKLTGTVNGVQKAYSFPLNFTAEETGHTYLPRLWAMRRIAHLTSVAQDNGDNREVVDEIVSLSKKYGIISAYTSFLVTDPNERNAHGTPIGEPWAMGVVRSRGGGGAGAGAVDAFMPPPPSALPGGIPLPSAPGTRHARLSAASKETAWRKSPARYSIMDDRPVVGGVNTSASIAMPGLSAAASFGDEEAADFKAGESGLKAEIAQIAAASTSGKAAVERAKKLDKLNEAVAIGNDREAAQKTVEDKTFYLRDGFWTDSSYDPAAALKPEVITFGTAEYFDLMKTPGISKYLSVGRQVIFLFKGHCYKIIAPSQA